MYLIEEILFCRSKDPKEKESPLTMAATEQTIVNTLRWIHLIECKLPAALDGVPIALKLSRLLCVFLAGKNGNDIVCVYKLDF